MTGLRTWSHILADAASTGLAEGLAIDQLRVHADPPATIEPPTGVVYPGGPGQFIDYDDDTATTACRTRVFWSLWVFVSPSLDTATWDWYYAFIERLPAALKLCGTDDRNTNPGLVPDLDGVSPLELIEYGNLSVWATSADLSISLNISPETP